MPVRAVVLPATPLLVPGVGGTVDPLAPVRQRVDAAVVELLDDAGAGTLAVLAHGSGDGTRTHGPRPSFAGAGVPDARVPELQPWAASQREALQVPASVALVCLAGALEARGARTRLSDVVALEVPAALAARPDNAARLAADLRGVAGIVVAGGGAPGSLDATPEALAPGVAAVLALLASSWVPEVRTLAVEHEHLPGEYRVTLLREP